VARSRGTTLLRAGAVESGQRRVVIEPLGLEFAGESLEIR
jgi:hypothetical protein